MDEIINAVCLHTAERHQVPVPAVEVELCTTTNWATQRRSVRSRTQPLPGANQPEGSDRAVHVAGISPARVYPEQIRLELDEEIEAVVSA